MLRIGSKYNVSVFLLGLSSYLYTPSHFGLVKKGTIARTSFSYTITRGLNARHCLIAYDDQIPTGVVCYSNRAYLYQGNSCTMRSHEPVVLDIQLISSDHLEN